MKKIFIIAVVAVAVTTVSCRKERTCECKETTTTVTTGFGEKTETYFTSSKTTMDKQKKNEFILSQDCFSTKSVETDSGGSGQFAYTDVTTTVNECELK